MSTEIESNLKLLDLKLLEKLDNNCMSVETNIEKYISILYIFIVTFALF